MRPTGWLASAAIATVAALMVVVTPAYAEPPGSEDSPPTPPTDGGLRYAERTAGDILAQPVRDVGLFGADIPDALVQASKDPYALPESSSCEQIGFEIVALNGSLGPEPNTDDRKENRVGKIAEAGGRAAVNSIIPFRTLVREVTGAAPAQRRLQDAVNLGYARRGFLRGVYQMRSCPSALDGRS